MVLALYLALLGAACLYSLNDWRGGWLLVVICGVLQDPVRKLTPGSPVLISFLVVGLYLVTLFSARNHLRAEMADFTRRFPRLYTAMVLLFGLLILSAVNGLITFGIDKWKVPLVSLFTYVVPVLAVAFGYAWLQREELMYRFFRVYAVVTSIALVGTLLEYLRVPWKVLGMVAFEGDYIRHLPGIQIRLLSGFYRGPDVMSWHAATLTSIALAMALRRGVRGHLYLWGAVAAWGFFNCMIAGRRKSIYYVVVFFAVFVWRMFRRLKLSQLMAMVAVLVVLAAVVRNLASDERTNVYARGAATTQSELAQRFEGGMIETFRQFGYMGAGLGSATQGVHHLLGANNIGWQEGGLGKLAMEIGLPGMLAVLILGAIMLRLLLRLTRVGDVPGSSQFLRAALFALTVANAATFIASAQAYTDAVLALTAGFFVGCLFASATLDERLPSPATLPRGTAPQLTEPSPA